jgi:hypothetical protein
MRASSEAGSRSRGCLALERGGASPEGASNPRVRRSLTRGGVQPSSEAESRPRGASSPRAKHSFARGGLGLTFWWAAEAARSVAPAAGL